ncbi:hypothetical protein AWB71_05306 [Caballeronia peredens]|nr:hypothetical protein AWB71_05306 [Caballeronia peredens]
MKINLYDDIIEKCNEDKTYFSTLSSDLKNNKNFLNAILDSRASDKRWYVGNEDILRERPDAITEDPDLMVKVLGKLRGLEEEERLDDFIPEALKANKAVMMAAASQTESSSLVSWLEGVDPELLCDTEFMLPCISRNSSAFNSLPYHLRNDKNFIVECIQSNHEVYAVLPDAHKKDLDIATEYAMSRPSAKHTSVLRGIPEEVTVRKDFILAVTDRLLADGKLRGVFYAEELDPTLRCDSDVMLNAVKLFPRNLNFASAKLRNDKDLVLTALRANAENPYVRMEESLFKIGPGLIARINESQRLKSLESIDLAEKMDATLSHKDVPAKTAKLKI